MVNKIENIINNLNDLECIRCYKSDRPLGHVYYKNSDEKIWEPPYCKQCYDSAVDFDLGFMGEESITKWVKI
jgi:hypothetical protein